MKAIGYIRVSTEEQAKEGVSLDNQEEQIKRYCEYRGLELVDILRDEGISGSKVKNREGFTKIRERVEADGLDALIVYSIDRLSRDLGTLVIFEQLLDKYDVELHTIEGQIDTSSASGWMNFAMKAVFGEFERRQVKDRTRKALQHKKSQGDVVGSIPYGYRRVRGSKKLVEKPEEQEVVRMVNELYQDGERLTDIVQTLNEKRIKTRNGKQWTNMQVKRIIDDYQPVFQKSQSKQKKIMWDFLFETT